MLENVVKRSEFVYVQSIALYKKYLLLLFVEIFVGQFYQRVYCCWRPSACGPQVQWIKTGVEGALARAWLCQHLETNSTKKRNVMFTASVSFGTVTRNFKIKERPSSAFITNDVPVNVQCTQLPDFGVKRWATGRACGQGLLEDRDKNRKKKKENTVVQKRVCFTDIEYVCGVFPLRHSCSRSCIPES